MKQFRTISLSACIFLVAALAIAPSESGERDKRCDELLQLLAPPNVIDFSRETTATPRVLQDIRTSGLREILVLNPSLLSRDAVRSALEESRAQIVLRSGSEPGDIPRLLNATVRAVRVIAILPDSEIGVTRVFGEQVTDRRAVVNYMQNVRRRIGELPGARILSGPEGKATLAVQLLDALRSVPDGTSICLVCHTAENVIRLPDDSSVRLEDAYAALRGRGFVLTCSSIRAEQREGAAVLTTRRMEFDEVARSLIELSKKGFLGSERTLAQIITRLNRELNSRRGPADGIVKLIVLAAGSGVLTLGICQLNTPQCRCPDGCDCCKTPQNPRNRKCDRPCCQDSTGGLQIPSPK